MNTRNLGRNSGIHGPSVTLAPKGRIARIGKHRIVVNVDLGYAGEPGFGGAVYRHPELRLRTVDSQNEINYTGMEVTMRFQSNLLGTGDREGPGGFLAAERGPWAPCYAGTLSADHTWPGDSKHIARAMTLIDKARGRGGKSRFKGCSLLQLLIGLQRCGVEIRIWSAALDARRAARARSFAVAA